MAIDIPFMSLSGFPGASTASPNFTSNLSLFFGEPDRIGDRGVAVGWHFHTFSPH